MLRLYTFRGGVTSGYGFLGRESGLEFVEFGLEAGVCNELFRLNMF